MIGRSCSNRLVRCARIIIMRLVRAYAVGIWVNYSRVGVFAISRRHDVFDGAPVIRRHRARAGRQDPCLIGNSSDLQFSFHECWRHSLVFFILVFFFLLCAMLHWLTSVTSYPRTFLSVNLFSICRALWLFHRDADVHVHTHTYVRRWIISLEVFTHFY